MRHLLCLAILAVPTLLAAQTQVERPTIDFSGIAVGNVQMRSDSAAKFSTGGKPSSRFQLERVYLTFRMPAGERTNIRITTDIFQNAGSTYYAGWAIRLKYAILQHDLSKNFAGVEGLGAVARIGMLHNVVVEHVDGFWPRWLNQNALETHAFFASSDVGAATLLTLPKRRGEVYVTVMNGSNYTSAETDRFKDFAARFSFTPFASDSGMLRSLAISPWYIKGWNGSQFVLGGGAQVGPVSDGLQKDRRGVFVGLRDRKLTLGAEYAQRLEQLEGGANTVAAPRTVRDRTSNLVSVFTVVRPAELIDASTRSRFGLVGRIDQFKIDKDLDPKNQFLVLGAMWDLTPRTSLALDHQRMSAQNGSTTTPTKTWFLHWVANF